jgi:hypothetical protein
MSSCAITALVVVGLVVVAGLGTWGLGLLARADVPERIRPGCRLASPSKAQELLGPDAVTSTRRYARSGPRVLRDTTPCWVTGSELEREIIVSQHKGADARTRYEWERDTARDARVGYFDRDVPDVGDETFCTTADYGSVGVVARQDDQLVYVIVVPGPRDVSRSAAGMNDRGWQVNATLCLAARIAARAVLA